VSATTVNKVCGSGLKAIMLACQAIRSGEADVIVAGGMESMSRAPYLLEKAREGYQLGHGEVFDSMIKDGLWDPYGNVSMGTYGELCAAKYQLSREEQDDFAVRSYTRALEAHHKGWFRDEIVEVHVREKSEPVRVAEDERLTRFQETKLRGLRPAFDAAGTITAGNASGMNDGASAVVVLSADRAEALNVKPMARILGFTEVGLAPEWFTVAPVQAISKLLYKLRADVDQIDLYEVNEAFAVVPMVAMKDLRLNPDKLNIHGGAVALGHPIGATGARMVTTLLHALQRTGGKRGIASPCIGGGEAVAVAVEMCNS
jgi:acetyl-CoA C-acetyltransferase